MEEKLLCMIVEHCILIDTIAQMGDKIVQACIDKNIEKVVADMGNRERAINNLSAIQTKIENSFTLLSRPISSDILDIVRTWSDEFTQYTQRWSKIDEIVAEYLEASKHEITREIASIFTNKELHKGYNLTNVKK